MLKIELTLPEARKLPFPNPAGSLLANGRSARGGDFFLKLEVSAVN